MNSPVSHNAVCVCWLRAIADQQIGLESMGPPRGASSSQPEREKGVVSLPETRLAWSSKGWTLLARPALGAGLFVSGSPFPSEHAFGRALWWRMAGRSDLKPKSKGFSVSPDLACFDTSLVRAWTARSCGAWSCAAPPPGVVAKAETSVLSRSQPLSCN